MKRNKWAMLVLVPCLLVAGCSPLERQAYNTIIGAKAFLDSMKSQHPECSTANSTLCDTLKRATAGKDALITAIEVYCSGPQFEAGGACNAPAKGTPAAQQAADKLKSAIANYESLESDVRKA